MNGFGQQHKSAFGGSSDRGYGGGGNNSENFYSGFNRSSPPQQRSGFNDMKIGTWNEGSSGSGANGGQGGGQGMNGGANGGNQGGQGGAGGAGNFSNMGTFEIGTFNIQSNNGGQSGSSSRHNGYNNDGHPPGPGHRETGIIEKLLHSYGFIQCCDRQARLFFHFSQFDGNIEHLKIGDRVEFEMTYDPRTGKPIASSVSKITPGVPKKAHEKRAEMLLRWKLKGELSKKQELEFEKALDSSKSFSIKASKLLGQKLAREKKPKAPKKPKKLSGLLRSIADCLEEEQ